MADLGNLNFGIHLKDYTPQEYEAIKKKLVNMHATVSAKVGLKVDVKEIEDKVDSLLKNKTYKVKLEVDSESIKNFTEAFKGKGMTSNELRGIKGFATTVRMDADVTYKKVLQDIRREREQLDASIKKEREQLNASLKRGREQSEAELRAAKAASSIIRADAYANSQMKRTDAYTNSQKALEQLRNARLQAAKAADTHNSAMKRANTTMSSQSRIAGELRNQIANVYSIYTAERFIRGLYTIGGEFQKQRIALTSIIGDSVKAETIFNRIKELAVASPFQFKELASYAKQLSAYSIPYEELYDTTKRLADISAGVGVDMGRIILAYGQVRSAAFLRGQELRQFTEAGIPLVDELAKRFTVLENKVVSAGDVFDKISRKEVSFGMVKDVLWELTNEGGKFYNMQEALAESLAGKWSNLQDAWDVMMADIAEGNSGVLSDSLEILTKLMKHWKAVAAILSSLVGAYGFYKTAVIAVNAAHKATITINTLTNIINMTRAMQGLTAVTKSQAVAQGILNAVTAANPWMILITALGAFTGLYFTLREKTKSAAETIREFNVQVQEQNEKISEAKNKANSYISTMFDTSKAVDERRMAYEKLQGIYPSIFKNMSYEQSLLKGQIELLNMSNRAARTTARETSRINLERAYQGLIDAERGVKDAELYSVASDGHIMNTQMLKDAKAQLEIARSLVKEAKEDFSTILSITNEVEENTKSSWFTVAKSMADGINSLIPKDDEAYEEYAKRVKEERENADKVLNSFKKGNPYSEVTIRNAQKVFDVSKKIMDTLGVLGKSSGSEKDPIAEQWKNRSDLIEKAISSYEKWRKIEGEESASQRVKNIPEFAPVFDSKGVNLDLSDPSKAYKYIQNQLDQSKEKQKDLYVSLGVKIDKEQIENAKKEADNALKEIEKYISQAGEKWDLYKKLFEATGNKALSMNIAFGENISFESIVEDFRNQLGDALKKTGSKFSITDVLAMKEDDVKKQFGEGAVLKLYQAISEEGKKMRSESLDNLLGMIEDYKDYSQKIEDIERNLQKDLADIESRRKKFGEEATDKLITQRKEKAGEDVASIKFEQFKSSEDWAKTFDDLDRLSSATLDRLIKNLEEFKNTTGQSLKVNEFKELINVLKKLRDESESRNPFKTLSNGIKGYVEATKELKKAQQELAFIQNGGKVITGVSDTSHTETKRTDSGLSYRTKVVDKLVPKLKTLADAEKNVTDAQDKQTGSSDKVRIGLGEIIEMSDLLIGTLGNLSSMFDTLGNDSMADALSTIQSVGGGLLNIAQSGGTLFAGITSGNPMAIMQGAAGIVGGITGIIGSIAQLHDKRLERSIQRSKQRVEELKSAYDQLGKSIDRSLGGDESIERAILLYEQLEEQVKRAGSPLTESYKMQFRVLKDEGLDYVEELKKRIKSMESLPAGLQRFMGLNFKIGVDKEALEALEKVGVGKELDNSVLKQYQAQYAGLVSQRAEIEGQLRNEEGKKKSDAGKIQDYKNQLAELNEQIAYFVEDLTKDLYGIDFQDWASQISDALTEAFANGEDAAQAFDNVVNNIMRSVANNILKNLVIQPMFEKLQDKLFGEKGLFKEFTDIQDNGAVAAGAIKDFFDNEGKAMIDASQSFLEAFDKATGGALTATGESSTSGLTKGIQGVTEDTANLLGSYLNSIRQDVSVKRALLEKLGNEIFPKYNILAEQQLTQLRAIANNTLRSAQNTEANLAVLKEFMGLVGMVIDKGKRKINI